MPAEHDCSRSSELEDLSGLLSRDRSQEPYRVIMVNMTYPPNVGCGSDRGRARRAGRNVQPPASNQSAVASTAVWPCPWRLAHQLDLAGPPGLVDPRFERAVEAEHHKPALASDRLHPVGFLAGGRLWAEVEIDRAVSVDHQLVALVVLAGERFARLQLGARLRVVEHDRPEILCRNVRRNVEPVVLRAVERIARPIGVVQRVLRTLSRRAGYHRRRIEGGHVEV